MKHVRKVRKKTVQESRSITADPIRHGAAQTQWVFTCAKTVKAFTY